MTTPFKFSVSIAGLLSIHHKDLPEVSCGLNAEQSAEVLTLAGVRTLASGIQPLVRFLDYVWKGDTLIFREGFTTPANPEKSATLTKLRHDIVYTLYAYSCIDWEYVLDESRITDTNSRDMPLRRVIDKEKFYSRDRYRNWTAMVRDWLQGLPSAMGGMMFETAEIEAWQAAMGVEAGDDAYWDGMARAVGRIAKGVKREV